MKKIAAAKFKEKCLSLLDRLKPDGLIVTKHGKAVAKVIPVGAEGKDLIGALQGKIKIKGDLLSTGKKWNAKS